MQTIFMLLILTFFYTANLQAAEISPPEQAKNPPTQIIDKDSNTKSININSSDQTNLQTLKGIGPKKAQAIIEYRNKYGLFHSVNDLAKIKGFTKRFIARLLEQNPNRILIS